jgi:hypothetical protein
MGGPPDAPTATSALTDAPRRKVSVDFDMAGGSHRRDLRSLSRKPESPPSPAAGPVPDGSEEPCERMRRFSIVLVMLLVCRGLGACKAPQSTYSADLEQITEAETKLLWALRTRCEVAVVDATKWPVKVGPCEASCKHRAFSTADSLGRSCMPPQPPEAALQMRNELQCMNDEPDAGATTWTSRGCTYECRAGTVRSQPVPNATDAERENCVVPLPENPAMPQRWPLTPALGRHT